MKKLKPAYEAKGHTGRTFAKAVGVKPPLLSNFCQGLANPPPPTFKKMLAELDCDAQDVITPGEFDYGLAEGNHLPKVNRPDMRVNSDRADVRGPADGIAEFKNFCKAHGLTMWGFIKIAMPLVAEVLKGRRAA